MNGIDGKRILIKIFRRTCDGFTKFEAICSKNIIDCPNYFAMNIENLAHDLARDIKISQKNKIVDVDIEFPRDIYKICYEVPTVEFYESVLGGEIKVFWDRFGKAMLKD